MKNNFLRQQRLIAVIGMGIETGSVKGKYFFVFFFFLNHKIRYLNLENVQYDPQSIFVTAFVSRQWEFKSRVQNKLVSVQ